MFKSSLFDAFFNEAFRDSLLTTHYKDEVNGDTEYFKNGRLHNDKGPAVIKKDGTKEYWLNGRQVTEDAVLGKRKTYKIELFKDEKEAIERFLGRKLEE